MQQSPRYPQWYRTLRAFLLGTAFGMILFGSLQELDLIPPLARFPFGILLFTQVPVAFVLSLFEIGFAVASYRRLHREMDTRTALR